MTVCLYSFACLAQQGMMLLMRPDPESNQGAIVLRYLSSGTEVVLEDCCNGNAKFSPDGKKVVTHYFPQPGTNQLYIYNIDGSGRTLAYSRAKLTQWAANGYIYVPGMSRFPEEGGQAVRVHYHRREKLGPHGKMYNPNNWFPIGKAEVSMDGTKGIYTTQCACQGTGWGQSAFVIGEDKESAHTSPCVGSISPHGDELGKANPLGGGAHSRYAIYPWKWIYRYESDTRNTFYYRTPVDMCLDTFITAEIGGYGNSMSWGKDPDVLTWTTENAPNQAWMYRRSTREKTKIADEHHALDYYPRELTMADTSIYLTPLALEFETEIGDEHMPDSIVVYLKASHDLPTPTLTGVPSWLSVDVAAIGDRVECKNTIDAAQAPSSTGSYEATVTVSFEGYRQALFTTSHQYTVKLDVFEQRPEPIRFSAPAIAEHYQTGETIDIGYSVDCARAGDKVGIALSIDNGESWAVADSSFLGKNCGDNQVFSYVIPDSALFFSQSEHHISKAVEGSQCLIRLNSFTPGGPQVFSAPFSIGATGTAPQRSLSSDPITALSAMLHVSSHASVLSLRSPHSGAGRVLDIQGRTVARFAVESGARSVSLPPLRAGCYLVEVRYAAGGREMAVANPL